MKRSLAIGIAIRAGRQYFPVSVACSLPDGEPTPSRGVLCE